MTNEELNKTIKEIEDDQSLTWEYEIAQKIQEAIDPPNNTLTNEEKAEHFAFNFVPDYSSDATSWGSYYGPLWVLPDSTGQFKEFPGRSFITDEVLNYWRNRAMNATNPIFINRYADIFLDLGKKKDFDISKKVIESAISINQLKLQDPIEIKQKLKRAFDLCIEYSNVNNFNQLKEEIIKLDTESKEDGSPGLWGFSLDWLVLNNKKFPIAEKEVLKIVESLEERLNRLVANDGSNVWSIECAVMLLAPYYEKINDEEKIKNVLQIFEKAYRENTSANSDSIMKGNYLEKFIELFSRYSQYDFAKQKLQEVKSELGSLDTSKGMDFKEISAEVKIPQKDIDSYVDSIFQDNELDKTIARIAVNNVVKKDSVEKQLNDLSQKHPISFLSTRMVVSEYGFNTAKFGPLNESYQEHFLSNFSQNMSFQGPFLKFVLDKLKITKTSKEVWDQISTSPVFNDSDQIYLTKIFEAFWNNDFLTTSSLSIPVIESAIRNLFILNKVSYIKPNENGGYDVLSLNQLLDKPLIKEVFLTLGEDISFYLNVLLVDRLGWNLRNNYSHGINKLVFLNEEVANRLIHVLFLLSLIRTKPNE